MVFIPGQKKEKRKIATFIVFYSEETTGDDSFSQRRLHPGPDFSWWDRLSSSLTVKLGSLKATDWFPVNIKP